MHAQGGEKGQHPHSRERGRWPQKRAETSDIPRKTDTLAGRRKGSLQRDRDSPEAVWTQEER